MVVIERTEEEGEFVSVSPLDNDRVVLELGDEFDGWFVTLNADERAELVAALIHPEGDDE